MDKGAAEKVIRAVRSAKDEVVVVSPWIGREEARLLRDLSKRVKVSVYTGKERNAGLEELQVSVVNVWALLWISVAILSGVILYNFDPRFLMLSTLSLLGVPFLVKKKVPPWVKILDDLHAKIFVVDDTVFLTSANLTRSGRFRNLEFLLKVQGEEAERIKKIVLERVKRWSAGES